MTRHPLQSPLGRLVLVAMAATFPLGATIQGGDGLAVGEAEKFIALPVGQHPEGIAFDRDGNLYFGNRTFKFDAPFPGFDSELRKTTPDGTKDTVIATFARSPANALLGLTTDGNGNVYAAVHGGADHGVWRVSSNGKNKARIAGSEAMDFPNSLTFDARGNLYVTDSGPVAPPVGGAIWRLSADHPPSFEKWSDDPALAPFPDNPFGDDFVLPGANGIAFYPPDSLYVANTEKSQVIRVPILPDGSAGPAEEVTAPFTTSLIDGIAVDAHGNVHGVLPGSLVIGTPPLVEVNTSTGEVRRTTLDLPEFNELFDLCLSVAFDTLPGERMHLFVTAGDLDSLNPNIPPVGLGPGILRANVGVKGFLGH